MATIVIGADICPIEGNRPYFISGDSRSLFNDLLPELQSADLVIANLECPLIDKPSPIAKTGPTFGEPSACINGIKEGGIDVVCLANNHIMDHGPSGLRNTMAVCAQAGVGTVGAGANLEAARTILIRKAGSFRIGILAMAEHEFSIATGNDWGANPLDIIDFVRNVQARREEFDYLIVLVHGSAEFLVPTPRIKNTCRFMIEMGANAVVVQHPHCLGGWEDYRGGHIIYGQGALVMDEAIYRSRRSFHEGFLAKLIVAAPRKARLEIVPFEQSSPVPGARRLTGEKAATFQRELARLSDEVLDDAKLQARWVEFCRERRFSYMSGLLAYNRVLRKLNSRGLLLKLLCGRKAMLGIKNAIRCETHREALETIFRERMLDS